MRNLFRYLGFLLVTIFAFWLIKFFNISYPLTIVSTTRSNELAVVGEGKVEVVPDTAYVDAGIVVNNVTSVDSAQQQINQINNKIIETAKNLGIDKKDIKTSNYSIYPNYSYDGGQNRISGYSGSATVTIKVKKMDLVSKVIEEVTKAGANQVQGARFSVDEPGKYREEARNKAIENAKDQAQKMAKKLGIKLGKVVNVVESTPETAYPVLYKAVSEVGGGGGPQIEPGSQTITSTVTLYFERK